MSWIQLDHNKLITVVGSWENANDYWRPLKKVNNFSTSERRSDFQEGLYPMNVVGYVRTL
jgi:hypothetical protein